MAGVGGGNDAITAGIKLAQAATGTTEKPLPVVAAPSEHFGQLPNGTPAEPPPFKLTPIYKAPTFGNPELTKLVAQQDQMANSKGYLQSGQQSDYTSKLAPERNAALVKLDIRQKQLDDFVALRNAGPNAIRVMQATINKAGGNLPVDGIYDEKTAQATQAYVTAEHAKVADPAKALTAAADPYNAHGTINSEMDKNGEGLLQRAFVTKQWAGQLSALHLEIDKLKTSPVPVPDQIQKLQGEYDTLASHARAINDPEHMDNVAVNYIFEGLLTQMKSNGSLDLKKLDIPDFWSWKGFVQNVKNTGEAMLGGAGVLMSPISDGFGAAFDAYERAVEIGGQSGENFPEAMAEGVNSFFGSTYQSTLGKAGLGFLNPFTAASHGIADEAISETDTRKERDALVEQGTTTNPFALAFGGASDAFWQQHESSAWMRTHKVGWDPIDANTLGFATQVLILHELPGLIDPVGASFQQLAEFSNFGEVGTRAAMLWAARTPSEFEGTSLLDAIGREGVAAMSRTASLSSANGRFIVNGLSDVMRSEAPQSVRGLRDAIPGLDSTTAQSAHEAFSNATGGLQAARDAATAVVLDAYVKGVHEFKIGFVRQLMNKAGDVTGLLNPETGTNAEGLIRPAGLGHGLSAVTDGLGSVKNWLRDLASPQDASASMAESNRTIFVNNALDTALIAGNTTSNSLWNDIVRGNVEGTDLPSRLTSVLDKIYSYDNPTLSITVRGMMKSFLPDIRMIDNMPIGTVMEAMARIPTLEPVIQRLETLAAVLDGSAGEAALAQIKADLARGYTPIAANFIPGLVKDAASNLSVELGKELPTNVTRAGVISAMKDLNLGLAMMFTERLDLAGTDAAKLRVIARDLIAVKSSPTLQEEIIRLIQEAAAQTEQAGAPLAERIVRPGMAIKAKLGKLGADITTVVPPAELKFEYPTANEAMHGSLRVAQGARYMDAYFVPQAIQTSILNEMYNAATESQFFTAVERSVNASLISAGVDNPKEVLELLREKGSFRSNLSPTMARTVDADGNPVGDLQTLAQKMESIKVPQPKEVASLLRQALLDSPDATVAQRLQATVHTAFDKLGNISLHWEQADGKVKTLGMAAHQAHTLWKFMVVSNAGMPVFGMLGGYLHGKGNMWSLDRLKNAGLGFALGSLGMSRFILRVGGIEDRVRMGLDGGFTADNMIPGYAKAVSRRSWEIEPLRRNMGEDLVRVGQYGQHFENDWLVHSDPEWTVIKASDKNAPAALERIVNHQIHPESDEVSAILLRERAGHLGGGEFDIPTTADDRAAELIKLRQEQSVTELTYETAHDGTIPSGWSEKYDANNARIQELEDASGPQLVKTPFKAPAAPAAVTSSVPLTPLEQAAADAAAAVGTPVAGEVAAPTNESLLQEHADRPTQRYYRGEASQHLNEPRGEFWSKSESVAATHAGGDGIVYAVDLPLSRDLLPEIGEQAAVEDNGWLLNAENGGSVWADAATPLYNQNWMPESIIPTIGTTTGREAADKAIAEFLATDEGKLWVERWRTARLGASTPEVAITRMREFIWKYTDPEIAAMRVSGGINGAATQVEREMLQRKLELGLTDEIHGMKMRYPKNVSELFKKASDGIGKLILSGPTNINRLGFETTTFNAEFDRLRMEGVPAEEAQRIADQRAVEHVNSIMHRFNEPTRFSASTDLWAPFQHARSDAYKIYGKLILENPVRVIRVAEAVARVFNVGKKNGVFTKNELNGTWELTIPGSGFLGHHLFGVPYEVNFTVPLQDFLFIGAGAYGNDSSYALGMLPSPGGPWWGSFAHIAAEADPSLFEGDDAVHKWMFGYGPNGNLISSNTSRLWMAMTGDSPPWEVNNQAQWGNTWDKYSSEVGVELVAQNRKDFLAGVKGAHPLDWVPTDEQVTSATQKFFKMWSVFGAVVPARTYPVLTNRDNFLAAQNAYSLGGLLPYDPAGFLAKYPQYEPYVAAGSTTDYTGPQDYATLNRLGVGSPWSLGTLDTTTGEWLPGKSGEDYSTESKLGYRTNKSWGEIKDQMKLYARTTKYYNEFHTASLTPDLTQRERAIVALRQKYSDVVDTVNRKGEIKSELWTIANNYPKSMQASAYQRVQATYGLSNSDFQTALIGATRDPAYAPNIWASSRYGPEIASDVQEHIGLNLGTPEALAYVSTLKPTEQARFWTYVADSVGGIGGFTAGAPGSTYTVNPTDPNSIKGARTFFEKQKYAVQDAYPQLAYKGDYVAGTSSKGKPDWVNPFTKLSTEQETEVTAHVNAAWDSITRLSPQLDAAYKSKNYKAVDALNAQMANYYDITEHYADSFINKMPDLTTYYNDLHAATVYDAAGNKAEAANARTLAVMDRAKAPMYLTNEQEAFLHKPASVQAAYVASLVDNLDMPPSKGGNAATTKYVKDTTGLHTMYWDHLSPFQQAQLTALYPNRVEGWKYSSEFYLRGAGANHGGGYTNKKTGQYVAPYVGGLSGAYLQGIPADLQWAHGMLGQYDKRGGQAPPAAYAEYLKLPKDAGLKADFLAAHPDVEAWMQQGPLGQMSAATRDAVISKLIKYSPGSSSSGSKSSRYSNPFNNHSLGGPKGSGFGDLKWAKQQLWDWSRRPSGSKAPPTYDLWLNMPSGQPKALYLEQHPEIGQWLRLGPMANMPEEYKAVVSSIMQQYGDWTAQQNPLGDTISQFYATPQYAKEQFLANHPELQVYWAQTKTPQELAMSNLENTYFQIQDAGGKQAFLLEHPELQLQFVNARTARYEKFLNQVAAYMGANPELFQGYLKAQTEVLTELLRKFAEPNLIREQAVGEVSAGSSEATDNGRQRAPQHLKPARVGV